MATDLIESLSGGELAPYNSGEVFAPTDSWAQNTDVDLLHERQHAPQTLTFFGHPLPGVTEATVEATLNGMATLFIQDMAGLKYPPNLIGFAAKYFRESALKPPRRVRAVHNFELPGELANDWMAVDFCNHLENVDGGTKRQKQQFLGAAITWLAKLAKHANSQKLDVSHAEQPRMAPNSTEAILNSLSDSDYNKVIKINEQALAKTLDILAAKWGNVFKQNIQIAQDYLSQLPSADQHHFDQFTTGWVHMRNTPEFITAMFDAATGAHSIGNNGASIAKEIAECERCMKTNRKQWLGDNALQARYRTLLTLRDGG